MDGETSLLDFMDVSSTVLRGENAIDYTSLDRRLLDKMLQDAAGVVLLYDITSRASYERITKDGYLHVLLTRRRETDEATMLSYPKDPGLPYRSGLQYPAGAQRFGCVLVGSKLDLAAEKREVDYEEAEEWADSQGFKVFELDTSKRELIVQALTVLVRSIKRAEKRDLEDLSIAQKRIIQEKGMAAKELNQKKDKRRRILIPTFRGTLRHAFRRSFKSEG